MSHDFHERLPGFDPGNILHDGCEECEDRISTPLNGLTTLDSRNFRQAWADMLTAKIYASRPSAALPRNVSRCDQYLMNTLYTVAVLLERHAGTDPREVLALIDTQIQATEMRLAERGMSL